MAENKIFLLLTLMTRRQPTISTREEVVDAMKRAADAMDAFTREW